MKNYYWIGARQSDIANEEIFRGSITKFGETSKNNLSFNLSRDTYSEKDYLFFLCDSINKVVEADCNAVFVFSNPLTAYKMPEQIIERCECLNDRSLVNALNDKFFVRQFLSDVCKMPPYIILNGKLVLEPNLIKTIFSNKYNSFVVQKAIGGGGRKSFLLNKEIELLLTEDYLITPFLVPNIPLNVHCIIYSNDILILPPSMQLIVNNFNYIGADFFISSFFSFEQKNALYNYAYKICKRLQKLNVKGLIGLDFLFYNNDFLFLESNFRFQGSSFLLNKGLNQVNSSLYKLVINSFQHSICQIDKKIYFSDIDLSFIKITSDVNISIPFDPIAINYDGFDHLKDTTNCNYKYNMVYDKSIITLLSSN